MTGSVRRQPFAALCGGSQKTAKRCCNRIARRGNRVALLTYGAEASYLRTPEALSRYAMPQDGSRRYRRFDPIYDVWHRWVRWVRAK